MSTCDAPSARLWRKIWWRVIPILGVVWLCSYVDRSSLGYVAVPLSRDLGLSATDFGFAAGIVFASAQQPGRADHRHPPADRGRRDARAGPAGPAANSRGHHGHPRRGRSGAIAVAAYASNAAICLSAVCVAVAGSYSAIPHFWRLPSPHLSGPATASGIDLIPCGANLSALAGRYVTGFAVDHTGNYR